MATLADRIKKACKDYEENGYAVIEDFLTPEEVQVARAECGKMVRSDEAKQGEMFPGDAVQYSDYMISCADKIGYFFEKSACDPKTKKLLVPVEQSMSRIGYAIHMHNPVFKKITFSQKIKDVFREIGMADPTIVQSMIIFKNPQVGGEFPPHQDASYLTTDPVSLAGCWMALDDATIENGCLEFIPGSHKWPLQRRYAKIKEDSNEMRWDTPMPDYDFSKFVKVPVKKGSVALLHGLVVHRSNPNKSQESRWVYAFHAFDKSKATWRKDNWLQTVDYDSIMPINAN